MDAEDERNARRLRLVDERLDAVFEQVDAVDTVVLDQVSLKNYAVHTYCSNIIVK